MYAAPAAIIADETNKDAYLLYQARLRCVSMACAGHIS